MLHKHMAVLQGILYIDQNGKKMALFSPSKSVFMHRSVCDYRGETATYTLPAITQILRCTIAHTHHLSLPLCVQRTLTYQHIPPAHPVVSLCVTSNYSACSRCWRGQPHPLAHDHRGPAASRGLCVYGRYAEPDSVSIPPWVRM